MRLEVEIGAGERHALLVEQQRILDDFDGKSPSASPGTKTTSKERPRTAAGAATNTAP